VMIEFADKVYLATSPGGTVVAVQMALQAVPLQGDVLLEKFAGW
jgi:hypothetical protein